MLGAVPPPPEPPTAAAAAAARLGNDLLRGAPAAAASFSFADDFVVGTRCVLRADHSNPTGLVCYHCLFGLALFSIKRAILTGLMDFFLSSQRDLCFYHSSFIIVIRGRCFPAVRRAELFSRETF